MNKKLQYFYSIPLCAYLKMNGLEIVKIAKHKDTGKTIFYFETGERLDGLIKEYKDNEFLRKLNESMKEVRSMI